ncbi:Sjoegren syndrome/scleroderma autoantigen 1 homolog isoform X2 [Varroa destructor]|uniref:Sjoegren syndrome/scleroderma autoantigen 1 n=1 Tax=Varroa destructor TaxID=109461 RepID=A0A7M7JTD1_VARDE|nr:Sjoegren syndrome/scleroderma autoantigen 1 homolog isoform X2 [Varroa destructor]
MCDDWRPPTEAELKVIEARRERNDKISSIIGGYLLRGYKMLGETCELCDTIILETRQGVKYCVACHEVDAQETSKDDPVMNEQAARRLCQEHSALTIEALPSSPAQIENNPMRQEASVQSVGSPANDEFACVSPERHRRLDMTCSTQSRTGDAESQGSSVSTAPLASKFPKTTETASTNGFMASPSCTSHVRNHHHNDRPRLSGAADILTAKIQWATKELELETRDLTRCSLLAQLIRDCSEALATVNKNQSPRCLEC